MDSLQVEIRRLFMVDGVGQASQEGAADPFQSASGAVRALVMTVHQPQGWGALSRVWRGVQSDLQWPAPAIAVSGRDGLALWFSVATTVELAQARRFLRGLKNLYLADVPAGKVSTWPSLHEKVAFPAIPRQQGSEDKWSAFIAQDLAPIFDESPWLDTPPNDEGQATLLRGVRSIPLAMFDSAATQLEPDGQPEPIAEAAPPYEPSGRPDEDATAAAIRFLTRVMNDDANDMAHRLEAAKLLLAHAGARNGLRSG